MRIARCQSCRNYVYIVPYTGRCQDCADNLERISEVTTEKEKALRKAGYTKIESILNASQSELHENVDIIDIQCASRIKSSVKRVAHEKGLNQ